MRLSDCSPGNVRLLLVYTSRQLELPLNDRRERVWGKVRERPLNNQGEGRNFSLGQNNFCTHDSSAKICFSIKPEPKNLMFSVLKRKSPADS